MIIGALLKRIAILGATMIGAFIVRLLLFLRPSKRRALIKELRERKKVKTSSTTDPSSRE